MTHYHHQEHLDTYAAVAGNCPANLLMAGLSAVSLGKKRERSQMDLCARCLGSCLNALLLVRDVSLTKHLTGPGAAC